MKNKTLLGAVSAYAVDVTAPESGGAVSVTPNAQSGSAGQPNADGTYNINLPAEYRETENVAATVFNTPVEKTEAENGDVGNDDGGEDDSEGGMKKYLPWLIGGGLLLFFFMRKK